jgi:hypothetical protein
MFYSAHARLFRHVSKQMLKHYSHIRMEAKRRAVDSLVSKKPAMDATKSSLVN